MVPVWLLDIDGVLNAGGIDASVFKTKWPKATWLETRMRVELDPPWEFANNGPVHLAVAEPVRDFIVKVHEAGLATIRWHTTWRDAAQQLAQWLTLPTFPVQWAPEYYAGQRSWWKVPAAVRVVKEEGRRLLWTDDDLARRRFVIKRDHPEIYNPTNLIVSPSDRFGLSPNELQRIWNYLEKEKDEH